jgi:hypothetical protein
VLNNPFYGKKHSFVYGRKDITMEQIMELSETVAEIWHLKKKLNEIYDEKKQICSELLEVSRQLDRKINRYLKMNEEEISCLTKTGLTPQLWRISA